MVNLVIVSHSWHLAEGIKEMAAQMTMIGGDSAPESDDQIVRIESVGGICDDGESWRLGTDPTRIFEAIERVWTEEGVLIFVDMGSAVLSAEMALELLPEEMRTACRISNAPVAEGAVMAALESSLGNSLDAVNSAAESAGALIKVEHL